MSADMFRKLESEGESCVRVDLHHIERELQHIEADQPGVRLYCVFSDTLRGGAETWSLQLRGAVRPRSGGVGKHFAIASASMSRDDLVWLKKQVDAALKARR